MCILRLPREKFPPHCTVFSLEKQNPLICIENKICKNTFPWSLVVGPCIRWVCGVWNGTDVEQLLSETRNSLTPWKYIHLWLLLRACHRCLSCMCRRRWYDICFWQHQTASFVQKTNITSQSCNNQLFVLGTSRTKQTYEISHGMFVFYWDIFVIADVCIQNIVLAGRAMEQFQQFLVVCVENEIWISEFWQRQLKYSNQKCNNKLPYDEQYVL